MEVNEKLDSLGTHFANREYDKAVELIRSNKQFQFENIRSEEQAEVAVIGSFSFFYLKDFNYSLLYSLRLLRYIEGRKHVDQARELYEDLVLLIIDSYLRLGKQISAYFIIRRKAKNIAGQIKNLNSRYETVKDLIADSVALFFLYFFPIMIFIVVAFQQWLEYFSFATYFALIASLIVIALLVWWQYDRLKKIIKTFL